MIYAAAEENTSNWRTQIGLFGHKTNAELEHVVIGRVSSCPVVFPDLRAYLEKAPQLICGFLVAH